MIEKPPPSSYSWYPFRAFGTTSFASFLRARHDLVRVKPVTASVGVGCFGGSERKKKGRKFLGLDMGSWNMTTTQTIDVYREIPQNYLSQHFSIKFDPSKKWASCNDPYFEIMKTKRFENELAREIPSCYPWTSKPWKMKVLNPQYMGYNP